MKAPVEKSALKLTRLIKDKSFTVRSVRLKEYILLPTIVQMLKKTCEVKTCWSAREKRRPENKLKKV